MALSEDANPIEGWTTTMIWKYKHGKVSTVKELADGLRGFDDEEMKGWKISEDEEQYPLVKILTKKAIHELVLHCEKNSFVPPTREEAFGEVEEYKSMTMETLREWYEKACWGWEAAAARTRTHTHKRQKQLNAIPSRSRSNICRREKEIMKCINGVNNKKSGVKWDPV